MSNLDYAQHVLAELRRLPASPPSVEIDDTQSRNAGRCMAAIVLNRLGQNGHVPEQIHHSLFEWGDGVFGLKTSRVADQFWTNLPPSMHEEICSLNRNRPAIYVFAHFELDSGTFHVWSVPVDVVSTGLEGIPPDKETGRKTILISPKDHRLHGSPRTIDFAAFYTLFELTNAERAKLVESTKTDANVKSERQGATTYEGEEQDEGEAPPSVYTRETVDFLLDLPAHVNDRNWHEETKSRYQRVLRDPSQTLVDQLAKEYIQKISPEVAGGTRHLSILKKNDYGRGGYYDHYWFAFYDPASRSKTRSVQLFAAFLGAKKVWRYGLILGNYCDDYLERLLSAMSANRDSVAEYVRQAPEGTQVGLSTDSGWNALSPAAFRAQLLEAKDGRLATETALNNLEIVQEFALDELPDHAPDLLREIGEYFVWCWPFFDAAMTGSWKPATTARPHVAPTDDEPVDVDEGAPQTIPALAEYTALSETFLEELQDALVAKQQAILVGPPGTSKTYIARQFARYFVRQREGHPQGSFDVLYMHANWSYEDFFEGLKPTSEDGKLMFRPRLGAFLRWVESLKPFSPQAVHVLVLDEINRCETAAVLGELLQLLEYRGTTVQLLSGRSFVLPKNVFIIGTMNSADRSIGRLDLALRRRFFWLDLHCSPATLAKWLQRPGNNPLGFEADSLVSCNKLLSEHGIPPEQHIGHALFMLQRTPEEEDASPNLDIPLSARHLRQIVQFSVLPYVRELMAMQFGQSRDDVPRQIEDYLLECVNDKKSLP